MWAFLWPATKHEVAIWIFTKTLSIHHFLGSSSNRKKIYVNTKELPQAA
jgi:hypothetical protein